MRTVLFILGLAFIWVLLWGSASFANVASGILVGTLIVFVVPDLRRPSVQRWPPIRPVAIARLLGHVIVSTVTSNVVLVREVLSPRTRIRTGVIGVPLPECSDETLTLITNVLALAPGTMPLEVTHDRTELYVHVLHVHGVEDRRREILHLTDLVVRAFGTSDAIAARDASLERRQS
jgi:multicomponent Na+:H+ antiporter subunit E